MVASRLLVWDTLEVFATILTVWLQEDVYHMMYLDDKHMDKVTRQMSIFNRRDKCQGIGPQHDGSIGQAQWRTSSQSKDYIIKDELLQKLDEDYTIDVWEEKMGEGSNM